MGKISKEDLFREIGEIDETYVEEARQYRAKPKTISIALKTLAAAASLVACVGVGYVAMLLVQPKGSASGSMGGAPDEGGGAMEAAQVQSSIAEDTGSGAAAGGVEEAAPQETAEEAAGQAVAESALNKTTAAEDAIENEAGKNPAGESIGQADAGEPLKDGQEAPAQLAESQKEVVLGEEGREQDSLGTVQDMQGDSAAIQEADGTGMDLAWEAARTDALYGRYVDVQMPEGYSFAGAARTASGIHVTWNKGMEEISISCRQADEDVSDWLVDVEKQEEYDLGLYTVPWSDSVPQELLQKVGNAVFLPDQVTLEIVKARTWEAGDVSGSHSRLGILYSDNVLVEISSRGPSAEEVYTIIIPED